MKGTTFGLWTPVLLVAIAAFACDDGSAKDGEVYLDDETGQWVVDHPSGGGTWLRCPVGQEWNEEGGWCEGTAVLLGYDEAKDACPSGFSWPGDNDFSSVLCDPVDISNCDEQYQACSDCVRCRRMFQIDTGTYISASSGEQAGGVTTYDFATGCADWGGSPEFTNSNVRCIKD